MKSDAVLEHPSNLPLCHGNTAGQCLRRNEVFCLFLVRRDGLLISQKDVVRISVKPKQSDRHYETLTIDIDLVPNNARMYVSWVNTQISFEIETSSDTELMRYIYEDLLTGKSADADEYGVGASYLYYQNTNLHDGIDLADMMIDAGGNEAWGMRIKMNIYEKLYEYNEALLAIDRAIEITKQSPDFQKEENRQRAIQEWEKEAERIRKKMSTKE